uniref:Uncharacterized protein n=1 Tax=Ovis aries TaxID=9940 RepID=A0AC11EK16_SHEEP
MDWLDLLAVQGTLKSLLQHHSSKASILWHSAFFTVHSHPYMTTGKTIALTRWTFVGKVMPQLLNMLSRLVITLVHGCLKCLCSLCHLLFDHSQLILIHGPNNLSSYTIFFFTASDFTSITRHIHSSSLFLL